MTHYRQKSVQELYRPKDVIPAIIGVVCAMTAAVLLANFVTSYAGI